MFRILQILIRHPRVTAMVISPLLFGVVGPARAADTSVTPPSTAVPQQRPPANDGPDARSGVIVPPSTHDGAINKGAPPVRQFPMPVIRPPQSPNAPTTNPKNQ